MTFAAGEKIGDYVIQGKIGEGGMGVVYRAQQPAIRREVVIKVLTTGSAGSSEMLNRFQREVDMIAGLEHPHILPVYDFGEVEGEPYIVMRYLPGGTFHDLLHGERPSSERLIQVLEHVAQALDYAHDRGVIHRDLKPANILLDGMGNAYLGDFGLAKTVEGTHDLTATGSILGTPAYMSPEQVRGAKLDRRSDVYSLAVVAYEALAGQRPFTADSPMDYLDKHLLELPTPISRVAPGLGSGIDEVFRKALSKDPGRRSQRATDFMQDLSAALAVSPAGQEAAPTMRAPVRSGTVAPRSARPARRGLGRWWFLLVLVPAAFLGLLVVGGGGIWIGSRAGIFGPRPQTYSVGDSPRALQPAGDSIWVAHALDETVAQLRSTACEQPGSGCGEAVATYPVADLPVALAFDGQRLWVAGALTGSLLALDPANGEVLGSTDLPNVPSNLLLAEDRLWTANSFAASISSVALDGSVLGDFPVDDGPLGLAYDGGSLWVAHPESGTLGRVNPADGSLAESFPLAGEPTAVAFDGRNLWVALAAQNEVAAIDPTSGAIVHRVAVGTRPVALLYDGISIWSSNQGDDTISEIDPAAGRELRQVSVPSGPWALGWVSCGSDCGDLWVASEAADSVSRLRVQR